jgi:type II restriction/modification system DNA methylase subunit YeeA
MLEFDKELKDYVFGQNGLYMRYSDDFIIVLPQEGEDIFKGQFTHIKHFIDSIPNLDLQPDKRLI